MPVCPTESLGTARSLLGISQSLVSYWELVRLMGLSPTRSQSITSLLLGSVHHMCPAGSQGISWGLVHRTLALAG